MLFRAISGLMRPTSGRVLIDGKQLWKDISFPPSVGIMIENIGLYSWLSGYENLKQLTDTSKK